MTPPLRKVNRRWAVDHNVEVRLQYRSIDEAIEALLEQRSIFLPGAKLYVEPSFTGGSRVVIRGVRYATPVEVAEQSAVNRDKRNLAEKDRRRRVDEALKVLQREAPSLLTRSNVTADEALEESAC